MKKSECYTFTYDEFKEIILNKSNNFINSLNQLNSNGIFIMLLPNGCKELKENKSKKNTENPYSFLDLI